MCLLSNGSQPAPASYLQGVTTKAAFMVDQSHDTQAEAASYQLPPGEVKAGPTCSTHTFAVQRLTDSNVTHRQPKPQSIGMPRSNLSQQLREGSLNSLPQRHVAFHPSVENIPVQSELPQPRQQHQPCFSPAHTTPAATERCQQEGVLSAEESSSECEAQPAGTRAMRKRKAASPLTSVDESGDAAGSTSSVGSEVSSAGAFQHRKLPGLVLQTRNLKVQCSMPRSPASLSTCSSLRSSGSFLATLSEEGRQTPWTPRASLCAAMNGVVISPARHNSLGHQQLATSPWSTPHSVSPWQAVVSSPAEANAVSSFFGASPFVSKERECGSPPIVTVSPAIRIPVGDSRIASKAARRASPSSSSLSKLRSLDSMLRRIAVAEERAVLAKSQM